MKNPIIKILRITPILIVLAFTCIPVNAQTNSFYVYFIQNGKRINIEDSKVELKKEPFQIYIESTELMDIYLNAAYKNKTYSDAKNGKLMQKMNAFSNLKTAEPFFLNKGTINLYSDKCVIWEKGKTDAEQVIKSEEGRYIVFKNIDKIYSVDKKTLIKIEDLEFNLNLVLIYAEKDENNMLYEIQRELVKIKWVDLFNEETINYTKQQLRENKLREKEKNLIEKRKQRMENQDKKRIQKIEKKKEKESK
jgi:hypothetical protein